MSRADDCPRCGRPIVRPNTFGTCRSCYRRDLRIRQGLTVRLSARERLEAKYEVDATTGCWVWNAARSKEGYGQFNGAGERWAHRASYVLNVGPIPKGLVLDHLCRNRACVNPAHLEPVTQGENSRRGMAPKVVLWRGGVCARGHDMSIHAYVRRDGGRFCRKCANWRSSQWRKNRSVA